MLPRIYAPAVCDTVNPDITTVRHCDTIFGNRLFLNGLGVLRRKLMTKVNPVGETEERGGGGGGGGASLDLFIRILCE